MRPSVSWSATSESSLSPCTDRPVATRSRASSSRGGHASGDVARARATASAARLAHFGAFGPAHHAAPCSTSSTAAAAARTAAWGFAGSRARRSSSSGSEVAGNRSPRRSRPRVRARRLPADQPAPPPRPTSSRRPTTWPPGARCWSARALAPSRFDTPREPGARDRRARSRGEDEVSRRIDRERALRASPRAKGPGSRRAHGRQRSPTTKEQVRLRRGGRAAPGGARLGVGRLESASFSEGALHEASTGRGRWSSRPVKLRRRLRRSAAIAATCGRLRSTLAGHERRPPRRTPSSSLEDPARVATRPRHDDRGADDSPEHETRRLRPEVDEVLHRQGEEPCPSTGCRRRTGEQGPWSEGDAHEHEADEPYGKAPLERPLGDDVLGIHVGPVTDVVTKGWERALEGAPAAAEEHDGG